MTKHPARRSLYLLLAPVFASCFSLKTQAQPLIQPNDLQYLGAFRLPEGDWGGSTFSYGGTALVFNPANQSLFLVGHDQHEFVAEVSVPTPVNGNNLDDLPTATVLQNFTDASEGLMYEVDAEGFDAVFPNPTRGKFQIRFPAPRQASVEIRCFNVLGEPVSILKRQLSGSHLELATEEAGIVAAGIYFLSCFENGRAMGTLPLAVH